jgi:hypothetical protein
VGNPHNKPEQKIMSGVQHPYEYQYEHVATSQTAHVLGGTGAIGDYLHRLICTVSTAATGSVTIIDGSFSHILLPASAGTGVNVYNIEVNAISRTGAWKVTTGAGVEVIAVGIFSA